MCLRRAPEKYIAGAALDRAALRGLFDLFQVYFLSRITRSSDIRSQRSFVFW
jgi:hypothetical protein